MPIKRKQLTKVKGKRWIYGTRIKKWVLVDKKDRDYYKYGLSTNQLKKKMQEIKQALKKIKK